MVMAHQLLRVVERIRTFTFKYESPSTYTSNVCRDCAFPHARLSLRLSPMRMVSNRMSLLINPFEIKCLSDILVNTYMQLPLKSETYIIMCWCSFDVEI